MCVFTNLDPVKVENLFQIHLGSVLALTVGIVATKYVFRNSDIGSVSRHLVIAQIVAIPVMVYATNVSILSLQARTGCPCTHKS